MAIIDFNSSIWSKPWFRKLPANAKILFIYLWTNNHKNLIGMYEIDFDTIQFETGLSKKQIEDTLSILYPKIKYDINKEIVWIVNHVQHQFMRTPNISPKIITGIEKCLISLDNHSFVNEFIKRYDTLSIQYTYCSGGGEGVRCIGEGKGNEEKEVKFKGAHCMPDELEITPSAIEWCKKHEISKQEWESAVESCRQWAKSKGTKRLCWISQIQGNIRRNRENRGIWK